MPHWDTAGRDETTSLDGTRLSKVYSFLVRCTLLGGTNRVEMRVSYHAYFRVNSITGTMTAGFTIGRVNINVEA
jgi:hypothetical protein